MASNPSFTSNHPEAALLLCRFQQFKDVVNGVAGPDLVSWLHECHQRVDSALEKHKSLELYKFQNTIGFEAFMIGSGTVSSSPGDVHALISLSHDLQEAVSQVPTPKLGEPTQLTFVVTAGEASTAIVGTNSLSYGVTGEPVWTALWSSNLSTHQLLLTESAFKRVVNKKNWQLSQHVDVPGQGRLGLYVEAGSPPLHATAVEETSAATTSASLRPMSPAATHSCHPWLLTFASPQLEQKFLSYFNRSLVSMDAAFYLVVVISQALWVFKWQWGTSLMGLWMCLLLAINAFMLMGTCFAPAAYVNNREPLCITSHIIHKVVQVIVSTTPGSGTMYSLGYNAVVALVETSGFAQVWMLTFGMRVRLWQHLLINLFDVLMAVVLEDHLICGVAFPRTNPLACNAAMWVYTVVGQLILPCALAFALERSSRRKFAEHLLK